jgi:hypothetical protein
VYVRNLSSFVFSFHKKKILHTKVRVQSTEVFLNKIVRCSHLCFTMIVIISLKPNVTFISSILEKVDKDYTGCLKIIVFRVRGLVGDILLTK